MSQDVRPGAQWRETPGGGAVEGVVRAWITTDANGDYVPTTTAGDPETAAWLLTDGEYVLTPTPLPDGSTTATLVLRGDEYLAY